MSRSRQVAIVTGGGRGLGRAFALALAGTGAHVVITARSEGELQETAAVITAQGGAATAIAADVTDRVAVEGLVARIEQQVGPVDLLINNAGVFRALGLIAEVDPDEWWREVEINLRGPYLYLHAVLPHMLLRRHGRIINVASGAGTFAFETISAYTASKTALLRLTETAALETRAHGIAVFALNPGTVRTALTDYAEQSSDIALRAPLAQQFFKDRYATNTLTPMQEVVDLVRLLASGQADGLTGCMLGIGDDIPMLIQQAEAIQKDGRQKLSFRR